MHRYERAKNKRTRAWIELVRSILAKILTPALRRCQWSREGSKAVMQEHIHNKRSSKLKDYLSHLLNALFAQSGIIAYIPLVFMTFALFSGSSWQIFLTTNDVARYQCYALTFWLGSSATLLLPASQCAFLHITSVQPPFHLLPIEYPPLTLVPFSLALIAPLAYYQLAFALLMSLTSVLVYWVLLHYGPRGAAVLFAFYILIGAIGTAQNRFDLLPSALTLLAIIAAERKRWTAASIALAFGFLLKLYPILLLPAFFLAEQVAEERLQLPPSPATGKALLQHAWSTLRAIPSWRWKNLLLFCSISLAVTVIFAIFNVQGATVSQLSYFLQRPVQVEAMGSTLLWLASLFGVPYHVVYTYGSLNMLSSLGGIVAVFGEGLFLLGYGYTIYLQWRGKLDLTQTSIALLLVFIATGKVFSPQYLIWLIPLLAYAGAYDMFWLFSWGTISALTTFIYIYLYSLPINSMLIPTLPVFTQTVAVRNTLLLLLAMAYLFNWFQARQRKPIPPSPTGRETRHLSLE